MKCNLFILLLLISTIASAQEYEREDNWSHLESEGTPIKQELKMPWNHSLGVGIGYSHVFNALKGDEFVELMPTELFNFDLTIFSFYMGFDFGSKKTGYDVYGFDEKVNTWDLKLGITLNHNLKNEHYFTFTPYVGYMTVDVDDTSHNSIGARTDYDTHQSGFFAGAKLAYCTGSIEYALHGSNREFGISIGIMGKLW